jgi:DNA invertase Pin-like site-specific DNA recombinase
MQGIDTTTPSGKARFGMLSVFADFERSVIQERAAPALLGRVEKANASHALLSDVQLEGGPRGGGLPGVR